MAHRTNHDTERDEEFQHGYQAAQAGQVDFRHSRYWIDDRTGAELCRPGVVAGIVAYQRDADALEVDDAKFYDDNIAVWDAEERARQAAADAAELEGVLQAEYRDDYETRRDLHSGAVQ